MSAAQSSDLSPQALRLLVNAGPTREYLDSVRFLSNPSSGKQGYAIAAAAVGRGHRVVLVSGPVALPDVPGARMVRVTSAAEMAEACKKEFSDCDAAILTAAVCDYRPRKTEPHKVHKTSRPMSLDLEPTEDICAALGAVKGRRIVMGFAMDDREQRATAEDKLKRKHCDFMVQNGPRNIGADLAEVRVLDREQGWQAVQSGTKAEIAERLLDVVEARCADVRRR